MTITAANQRNEIWITIKDVSKLRVIHTSKDEKNVKYRKEEDENDKYYIMADGEIIAVSTNNMAIALLFRTLSSKIDTDSHYMIIREPNDAGFTVEGFNPGKIL
jgi:hypothetical protein